MAKRVETEIQGADDNSLLALLGEELKQPLVAIAQIAELQKSEQITEQAKRALRTIDNVLLHRRIQNGQMTLELEPVHVGSEMRDVHESMKQLFWQQGCKTELKIRQSLQPVDVDRRVLRGLLESLWQSFSSSIESDELVTCRAQQTTDGIRVTMSSPHAKLQNVHFAKTNARSIQPIAAFAGPAADLLTARELSTLLNAKITKSARSIGVTLPVSKQLQMV